MVFRWPIGPIVLLLAERRLNRRSVIWRRRRRVIPILDSDRRAVAQTGGGTRFVGEASRSRWDRERWEHRL